jgi:hypothetical protein
MKSCWTAQKDSPRGVEKKTALTSLETVCWCGWRGTTPRLAPLRQRKGQAAFVSQHRVTVPPHVQPSCVLAHLTNRTDHLMSKLFMLVLQRILFTCNASKYRSRYFISIRSVGDFVIFSSLYGNHFFKCQRYVSQQPHYRSTKL